MNINNAKFYFRSALEGRNTRIVIVLIQRHAAPPGTEDVLATERATALYAACEVPAKSLYILPHGDHLMGYITRFQKNNYQTYRL